MFNEFFSFLDIVEDFLWGYAGVPIILFVGLYLSIGSNFVQIRKFPSVVKTFFGFLRMGRQKQGVHPLQAFFACVGGCVGVGNVVGICTAVQIGGPGALFWIWVTAIAGMMLKYGEVYLGVKYRVTNAQGGYNGGPMYYLQRVFKSSWIPKFVCVLLCLYGVEVYQFRVVIDSITTNLEINQYIVIFVLLGLVMFAGSGGVRRVGNISSAIIPVFVVLYMGMGAWVLFHNISALPKVLGTVFATAFTGHAAVGAFAGSSILMAMSHGVRRGCYTGDVGIGYASVIHSESSVQAPEKQASLVIFDIFLDTFLICTTSVLIVLVTDGWQNPVEGGMLVQSVLQQYFPLMNFFMPFFLFLLGFSTINAYFCFGLKSAEFLSPKRGRMCYYVYAVAILLFFSFAGLAQAQTAMAIIGALLLVINGYGIFRLRNEISYDFDYVKAKDVVVSEPVEA